MFQIGTKSNPSVETSFEKSDNSDSVATFYGDDTELDLELRSDHPENETDLNGDRNILKSQIIRKVEVNKPKVEITKDSPDSDHKPFPAEKAMDLIDLKHAFLFGLKSEPQDKIDLQEVVTRTCQLVNLADPGHVIAGLNLEAMSSNDKIILKEKSLETNGSKNGSRSEQKSAGKPEPKMNLKSKHKSEKISGLRVDLRLKQKSDSKNNSKGEEKSNKKGDSKVNSKEEPQRQDSEDFMAKLKKEPDQESNQAMRKKSGPDLQGIWSLINNLIDSLDKIKIQILAL